VETRLLILADNDRYAADFFKTAVQHLMNDIKIINLPTRDELIRYFDEPSNPLPLLLFVGINLPMQASLKSIRELRNRYKHNELCIVAYSCLFNPGLIKTARMLGANLCITKPTSNVILQNLILHMVGYAEELTGQCRKVSAV